MYHQSGDRTNFVNAAQLAGGAVDGLMGGLQSFASSRASANHEYSASVDYRHAYEGIRKQYNELASLSEGLLVRNRELEAQLSAALATLRART